MGAPANFVMVFLEALLQTSINECIDSLPFIQKTMFIFYAVLLSPTNQSLSVGAFVSDLGPSAEVFDTHPGRLRAPHLPITWPIFVTRTSYLHPRWPPHLPHSEFGCLPSPLWFSIHYEVWETNTKPECEMGRGTVFEDSTHSTCKNTKTNPHVPTAGKKSHARSLLAPRTPPSGNTFRSISAGWRSSQRLAN